MSTAQLFIQTTIKITLVPFVGIGVVAGFIFHALYVGFLDGVYYLEHRIKMGEDE